MIVFVALLTKVDEVAKGATQQDGSRFGPTSSRKSYLATTPIETRLQNSRTSVGGCPADEHNTRRLKIGRNLNLAAV